MNDVDEILAEGIESLHAANRELQRLAEGIESLQAANHELQRKLERAEEQLAAARAQAERWQTKARKMEATAVYVMGCASRDLNKEGLLDRLTDVEKARDEYWEMLCEASDALGGPTPEKAPFVAQHIRTLVEEKAKMQSAIDQSVQIVHEAMDDTETGFAGEDFAFGILAGLLGPCGQSDG